MNNDDNFTPLELPQRHLLEVGNSLYMVYKDHKQYVQVEAPSAQAAILASGVEKPLRVVRQDMASCTLISLHGKGNNGFDFNKRRGDASSAQPAAEAVASEPAESQASAKAPAEEMAAPPPAEEGGSEQPAQ